MINIQMELLRTFAMVADLGGITRAAEVLGCTQPAISLQLKRLEELVGVTLLSRSGRNVVLTEEGETLAVYARQILSLNDEAVSRLKSPQVGGGVRVGLPSDFALSLLPTILANFSRAHAGITLEVNCGLSRELVRGMRRGDYDVVIALCAEDGGSFLAKTWSDRLVWVGRAEGLESMADSEAAELPLIAYPQGCLYRQRMTEALNRAGRAWRVVYSSPSQSGIEAAARAGLGVTVLSEKTVPESLPTLPPDCGFPGLADVEVGLFYQQSELSEAGLRLVNFITASLDAAHGPSA